MGPSAASIYNSLILSYIILLFNKLELFPRLARGISLEQLEELGLEPQRLRDLLAAATAMGVLKVNADQDYQLTELGSELARNRGFFTWAIGGYSPLLESMDKFLAEPSPSWQTYVRSGYVAIGSDECSQELMQGTFDQVIDSLPATSIADLGCGNAGRLVELLGRRPELTGVGIDISPEAIMVAKDNRDSHGLKTRLRLVREDVFASLAKPRPELAHVELVMSFMMLHDLFNKSELSGGQLFRRLKLAFPAAKYFVLADTCADEQPRDFNTMPIFTMGYELIHSLRSIQLFPLQHYREQFAQGGLELVAQHDFGVPNTYLFVLKAK